VSEALNTPGTNATKVQASRTAPLAIRRRVYDIDSLSDEVSNIISSVEGTMRNLKKPGLWLGIVAVALAMSGSAVAASKITGAQIKDGTITAKDIKNNAVTPAKLSTGAMQALAGDPGPAGPAGPSGPAGPAGPSALGGVTAVNSAQVFFGPSDVVKSATAYCPAGQRVISGGGISISDQEIAATLATNDRTGWYIIGVDLTDTGGEYVQAQALCAPAGVAVASSAGSRAKNDALIAARVEHIKAQFADRTR
jgi:hypothetical protein